jgi:hypothetical protein
MCTIDILGIAIRIMRLRLADPSFITNLPHAIRSVTTEGIGSIPLPQPGQVAPETPAVPQTGHSMGTAVLTGSSQMISHIAGIY